MAFKQILWATIFIAACSQTSLAFQPVPSFEDRDFGFNLQSEYFSTEANLSQGGGGYVGLPNGQSFSTFSARMAADYQVQPGWRIGLGGEVVHAESSDNLTDRQTTELNNVFLESMYVIRYGRFLVAPQMRYLQSLKEVDPLSDDIIAGEGTNQLELGGWGAVKAGPFEPYFYLAYRDQNDGRAAMMPFQVGTKYFYQKMYVIGEIYGQMPLSNDTDTGREYLRTNVTNLRNGGSFRYYAVNQSFYEGRAELGYKVSRDFAVYGGAGQTINGKNAAYGLTVDVGLTYTLGAVERTRDSFADDPDNDTDFTEDEVAREHRKTLPPGQRRKKNEKFEPLREDYDENLFVPSN